MAPWNGPNNSVEAYLDVFGILESGQAVDMRLAFDKDWITCVQTSIRVSSLPLPVANRDALNLNMHGKLA